MRENLILDLSNEKASYKRICNIFKWCWFWGNKSCFPALICHHTAPVITGLFSFLTSKSCRPWTCQPSLSLSHHHVYIINLCFLSSLCFSFFLHLSPLFPCLSSLKVLIFSLWSDLYFVSCPLTRPANFFLSFSVLQLFLWCISTLCIYTILRSVITLSLTLSSLYSLSSSLSLALSLYTQGGPWPHSFISLQDSRSTFSDYSTCSAVSNIPSLCFQPLSHQSPLLFHPLSLSLPLSSLFCLTPTYCPRVVIDNQAGVL